MTLTDALVNSLGPCVVVPSGLVSLRVLRVRKPWLSLVYDFVSS